MATPFSANVPQHPAPAVKLATEPQLLRAIQPMLADRKWQDAPEAYSARCAAIKTIIDLLTNGTQPTALGVPLTGDIAADFATVMAACADNAEPGTALTWKPLTAKGASALIDWLGQQQWAGSVSVVEEANVAKAAAAASEARNTRTGMPSADVVPAGRYAIDTQDGALNEIAFYKVDRPTTGRWAGYVFVKRMIGGNPDVAVKGAAAQTVLAAIAADAKGAAVRYGKEIGECGRCGIELTNDESRAYGIGPDCRKKLGW